MIKSRLYKVGQDISDKFGDRYMSYMANRIIRELIVQQKQIGENEMYREHKFVDHEKSLIISEVPLNIKLSKTNYYNIIQKLEYGEKKNFVDEQDSLKWIEQSIGVTKVELDRQRQKELNVLDMMQNTGIIYHPESLMEMQAIVTIIMYNVYKLDSQVNSQEQQMQKKIDVDKRVDYIMVALLIEHLIGIVIQLFRKIDIE